MSGACAEQKSTQEFTPKLALAAVMLFAVGFWLGGTGGGGLPFAPSKDRPILRFIARAAKVGLWLLVAEPPRDQDEIDLYASNDPDKLNHRSGW